MQHDFILVDRSGSMSGIWEECLSSINSYAKDLAEKRVDTGITVITFDENGGQPTFDKVRDRIIPSTFRPISVELDGITPRGMTPLNDAIAKALSLANAGPVPGQTYDKVALMIVTDGMENASKEYPGDHGRAQVNLLLDAARAKGWSIIFIGANFDNKAQAAAYNNAGAQTTSVAPGKMGLMSRKLGATRAAYAVGAVDQMNFTDEDKAELSDAADAGAGAD